MTKEEMLVCLLKGALQATGAAIAGHFMRKALVRMDKAFKGKCDDVTLGNIKAVINELND